jgi:hypothetical protein
MESLIQGIRTPIAMIISAAVTTLVFNSEQSVLKANYKTDVLLRMLPARALI